MDDFDAAVVRELERLADLGNDGERLLGRETPGAHGLAEIDAVDELHEEVEEASGLPEVVDGDDVRVIEFAPRVGGGLNYRFVRLNTGVDIIATQGTPVMAAAGGVVSAVGFHPEYGNTVDIDHDNGLTSRYAHLLKSSVKVGDVVMKGQLVAQVGNTGRTTGPHLHFEVREKGVPLNPNKFFALDRKEGAVPVAVRK